MADQTTTLEKLETQSSIFEKTDPDFRRRLDQALIDHDPPTYKAAFTKFGLADKGISFAAFYRYARRIRAHAAIIELTHHALPDDCDPTAIVPKLLADRLLDAAIDESSSPRTLQRLTDAWRFAAQTQLALERHQAAIEEIKKKARKSDTDDLLKTFDQYMSVVRAEQAARMSAAKLASTPDPAAENPPAPNFDTETS